MTPKLWESIKSEDWRALAQQFVDSKDDEACIALMLRLHCISGDLVRMLKIAKIERYRFEYPVKSGRVDLVLFHADGGVSLIEIKGQNSVRDVVAGIGQLFLYEAMFLALKPRAKPPVYIHKYLISPIQGEDADRVDQACALSGVNFFRYAPFDLIRTHRTNYREWLTHGPEICTDTGAMD